MESRKNVLEDQVPEYGFEALMSTIENKEELLRAIREISKRYSTFNRNTNVT
ncbi:MAG TPA: hypothetical protein VNI77_04860 [Nitrososphaera sp.]|nr:hypothetical protein [Nitrososphaera sp.]